MERSKNGGSALIWDVNSKSEKNLDFYSKNSLSMVRGPDLVTTPLFEFNYYEALNTLSWVPNQSTCLLVAGYKTVKAYDYRDSSSIRKPILMFTAHNGNVKKVSFDPFDSNRFISYGEDSNTIKLWDWRKMSPLSVVVVQPPVPVNSNPSGLLNIPGSNNNTAIGGSSVVASSPIISSVTSPTDVVPLKTISVSSKSSSGTLTDILWNPSESGQLLTFER